MVKNIKFPDSSFLNGGPATVGVDGKGVALDTKLSQEFVVADTGEISTKNIEKGIDPKEVSDELHHAMS